MLNIVNRDEYDTFVPSPVDTYKMKERITSVRLVQFSHDEKYKRLKEKGLGLDITSSEIYVNGKKPMNGIFSPMFGADTTQDTPIFTCDCHKLTGGVNRGRICPECGTEVRTIEADLRITGYIDIAPYHIMSYHGFNAMSKVFKNLQEIITTTQKINRSGKAIDNGLPTIMDLYDDYDELYAAKTGIPKSIAWMSKIPVYSSRLRPLMRTNKTVTILDVNKSYFSLVELSNILTSTQLMPTIKRDIEIQRTLNQAQQDYNAIVAEVMNQINGKTGVFRRALASGRLDSSSRLVIALGPDLHANEVDVPYQLMMVQYEEEIAKYVSKMQNISISKAIALVDENVTIRNEYFVKIINQLLRSGKGIWCMVNRNPTISESGIQYARIRKIHDDPNDMTLHVPVDPLPLWAADFDGDQETLVGVKNPAKYHQFFLTMAATYAYLDRADGRFNRAMAPKREFGAILSAAWDIDRAIDSYLVNPDPDSYETLRELGVTNPMDETNTWADAVNNLWSAPRTRFKDRYFDPFCE